jgi:uncharacterized coiled-coil DUF342 family protein
LAGEAVLGTILEQVSKRILEKLERGKKLTTEDILLLYLDLTYRRIEGLEERLAEEVRSLRGEVGENLRILREEFKREIESLKSEIKKLEARLDETNRRIDRLYELLTEWRRETTVGQGQA